MKKAIFILLYGMLLLLLVEAVCAIALLFVEKPVLEKDSRIALNPDFGYENLNYEGATDAANIEKTEGKTRIFSYGASSTAGWPYGRQYSYTQVITCGHPSEVLNLAVPGFDSREVYTSLRHTLDYQPDIALIYTSQNIVENYSLRKLKLGAYSSFFHGLYEYTQTGKMLDHAINMMVSKGMNDWEVMPSSMQETIFTEPLLTESERETIRENYTRNIKAMIGTCRQNDVKPVFLVPVHNRNAYGPMYSFFGQLADKKAQAAFTAACIRIRQNLDAGDSLTQMLELEKQLYKQDSTVAILHHLMARTYQQLGNCTQSEKHTALATNYDNLYAVLPHVLVTSLREICAQEGVTCINLQQPCDTSITFFDDIHPTPDGHQHIARRIIRQLFQPEKVCQPTFQPDTEFAEKEKTYLQHLRNLHF